MAPNDDGPSSLVGADLSTVAFVRDYVEFHFDGPVLRSLTDPVVQAGGRTVVRADEGWRDALCDLINATVLGVRIVDDVSIELDFSGEDANPDAGRRLTVPLDQDSLVGPEAAHFMPADGPQSSMWIY